LLDQPVECGGITFKQCVDICTGADVDITEFHRGEFTGAIVFSHPGLEVFQFRYRLVIFSSAKMIDSSRQVRSGPVAGVYRKIRYQARYPVEQVTANGLVAEQDAVFAQRLPVVRFAGTLRGI